MKRTHKKEWYHEARFSGHSSHAASTCSVDNCDFRFRCRRLRPDLGEGRGAGEGERKARCDEGCPGVPRGGPGRDSRLHAAAAGFHHLPREDVRAPCRSRAAEWIRELPQPRRHHAQRLFPLEGQPLRPRALQERSGEGFHVRGAGAGSRLLQHPSADERVRSGHGKPLLRLDHSVRRVHHRRRSPRQLPVEGLARGRGGGAAAFGHRVRGHGPRGSDRRERVRQAAPYEQIWKTLQAWKVLTPTCRSSASRPRSSWSRSCWWWASRAPCCCSPTGARASSPKNPSGSRSPPPAISTRISRPIAWRSSSSSTRSSSKAPTSRPRSSRWTPPPLSTRLKPWSSRWEAIS